MTVDWADGVWARTYGAGPFYPAIQNGNRVWYWSDVTFLKDEEAYAWAGAVLSGALCPVDETVRGWNMYRAPKED